LEICLQRQVKWSVNFKIDFMDDLC
jgi:hypothetical protein